MPELRDRSGSELPVDHLRWRGDDRSPLMASELAGPTRDQIDTATRSIWPYRAALPELFDVAG